MFWWMHSFSVFFMVIFHWVALRENQSSLENLKKQIALREWQQKGGPKKLTLPLRSTGSDLAKLLSKITGT